MKYLLLLLILSSCGIKKTEHNTDVSTSEPPKGKNGKAYITVDKKIMLPTGSCKPGDPVVNQLYYVVHTQEYYECSLDKEGEYLWWKISFDQYICDESNDCKKM